VYQAGTQNWDFEQDSLGRIYVANNEGVLVFDGTFWKLNPLPNRTITRSIKLDDQSRLFVGGQDEFGYFQLQPFSSPSYHDLKPLIPEAYQQFPDVWDIVIFKEAVFFLSNSRVYQYDGSTISVFSFEEEVPFLGQVNGTLFAQGLSGQFYQWEGQSFQPTFAIDPLSGDEVTGLIPWADNTFLVLSLKNGIFQVNSEPDPILVEVWQPVLSGFLSKNRAYDAIKLKNGMLAIGTTLAGLMIIDQNGRPMYLLGNGEGLKKNTVLSLFEDRNNGLWLGLDNGIDRVEIDGAFRQIIPDGEQGGQAYAATVFDQKLFLGTSNGLFCREWRPFYPPGAELSFQKVQGTTGQVWQLDPFGNSLFLSHHEGLHQVDGKTSTKVSPFSGAWRLLELKNHPDHALVGSYSGLHLFRKAGNGLQFVRSFTSFQESSRIMAQSADGTIWVAQPYRGMFKIMLAQDLQSIEFQQYGTPEGLPLDLGNRVFDVNDEVLFATEKGLYRYQQETDRFVPAQEFNEWLGADNWVKFICSDQNGNYWFVVNEDCGVLWVTDEGLEKKVEQQILPELSGKMVGGFDNVISIDDHNILFATQEGFYILDPDRLKDQPETLQVVFHQLRFGQDSDSLFFSKAMDGTEIINLPYKQNGFSAAFSATNFSSFGNIQYQYRLGGLDEDFSSWADRTTKEYTNLPKGKYSFEVRAKDAYGNESATAAVEFEVAGPWYTSTLAISAYGLMLLLLFGASIWIPQTQYQKEKAQLVSKQEALQKEHQAEVEKSEKEIMKLKNEKLENEVRHKNQELASTAMHLVQKSEILTRIKQELSNLSQSKDQNAIKTEIRKLVKIIDQDIEYDKNWEQFEHHFDQVHHDFLRKLRNRFPQLTPKDLKLCAYLRMNLQTKEIAPLMNISVRGVEISRYRLRKKLELDRSTNLIEFLLNV
ncbi:MAG: triple tyrosine motif-containing protein, partial [Bacteroidota bacterium]